MAAKYIYKQESLGASVFGKQVCLHSSAAGRTPRRQAQNYISGEGEEGCSRHVVQQQQVTDRKDLYEFLRPLHGEDVELVIKTVLSLSYSTTHYDYGHIVHTLLVSSSSIIWSMPK